MKKIIIIGGGASGFFTAANLDSSKYEITILEQSKEVLQKVKISGGGRCNVSHACFDPRELVQFYPRGNKELRSVFSKFQPADTMAWFQERGVELKIEEDNRMFPESNSSQTIVDVLVNECRKKGVKILTQETVTEILPHGDQYKIHTTNQNFLADEVLFSTGSSTKAFKIIADLGHKIIKPVPSLFTFNIKNETLKDLMGTCFSSASVKIPALKLEESGALLITHWGLSGPAVLKLSAWGARELFEHQYQFEIVVNFIGTDRESVVEMLKELRKDHPKKSIGQTKVGEITNRFWQRILEIANIDSAKQIANLTNQEIQNIAHLLCENKMKVSGKSTFKEEFVTAGGVDLKEIDFKTMQSKILPNFFISGEVLNIDAVTGGFNFQACWSEGFLIAQYLNAKNS